MFGGMGWRRKAFGFIGFIEFIGFVEFIELIGFGGLRIAAWGLLSIWDWRNL
jgi:hypothetical protein